MIDLLFCALVRKFVDCLDGWLKILVGWIVGWIVDWWLIVLIVGCWIVVPAIDLFAV